VADVAEAVGVAPVAGQAVRAVWAHHPSMVPTAVRCTLIAVLASIRARRRRAGPVDAVVALTIVVHQAHLAVAAVGVAGTAAVLVGFVAVVHAVAAPAAQLGLTAAGQIVDAVGCRVAAEPSHAAVRAGAAAAVGASLVLVLDAVIAGHAQGAFTNPA